MTAVEWRAIPGWEGLYEASSDGQIRSLDRVIISRTGQTQTRPGVVRKQYTTEKGYRAVGLSREGMLRVCKVHRLVMLAFCGPVPEGMQVRHLDGNPANNHLTNLRYGTPMENAADKRRHGTEYQANKTRCVNGHLLSGANLRIETGGVRRCLTCQRERERRRGPRVRSRRPTRRAA